MNLFRAFVVGAMVVAVSATAETKDEGSAAQMPAADAEAVTGDVEYGAYLAAECTTCHAADSANAVAGMPSITGWEPEVFVLVLEDYASGFREHGPMQMIAGRLGEEEMAALAAYFATLD